MRALPLGEPHHVSTSAEARGAPAKVPSPCLEAATGLGKSPMEVCPSRAPKSTQNAAASSLRRHLHERQAPVRTCHTAGPQQVGHGLHMAGGTWGMQGEKAPEAGRARTLELLIWFPGSMEEVCFLRQTGALPQIRKPAPRRNLDGTLQKIKQNSVLLRTCIYS